MALHSASLGACFINAVQSVRLGEMHCALDLKQGGAETKDMKKTWPRHSSLCETLSSIRGCGRHDTVPNRMCYQEMSPQKHVQAPKYMCIRVVLNVYSCFLFAILTKDIAFVTRFLINVLSSKGWPGFHWNSFHHLQSSIKAEGKLSGVLLFESQWNWFRMFFTWHILANQSMLSLCKRGEVASWASLTPNCTH